MTTAQELLDAGVDPKNIPTLTAELNKPEVDFRSYPFGGLADTEFMVEAGRFGNTDANLQLGLNWWWDTQGKHTQIFDTGEPFDTDPWNLSGLAYGKGGPDQGDNTGDDWAQMVGYEDGKDWFDQQKSLGNLRPEVVEKGYEKWNEDMRELGKNKVLVMYAQVENPLSPFTWSHELSHIGQYLLRESGLNLEKIYGTTIEGKQRIRDIMMLSPAPVAYDMYGDPIYDEGASYRGAVDWLHKKEYDYEKNEWIPHTEKEIRDMARDATLENQLANQLLESQGGLSKPIGDLSQYEKEHMPGFWQSLINKATGWIEK